MDVVGKRLPKNRELRGGLRWRLSSQVDGPFGLLTAALALVAFLLAPLNFQAVFWVPVVMILGASASFVILFLGAALSLLLYLVSGSLAPFRFFAVMLPAGPVALKVSLGLLLSIILLMSLIWRLCRRDLITYGSAFLRTTVYALIGAAIGAVVSIVL